MFFASMQIWRLVPLRSLALVGTVTLVTFTDGAVETAQAEFARAGALVAHPPLPRQANASMAKSHLSNKPDDRRWLATEQRRLRKARNGKVMQIVVSLRRQRMTVYEDGRPVKRSAISSGKAGHRTPKGIFSIIQKRRYHRSNIYSNAPMPFMQRLTWSGIAFHQGRLPGYAASHGCIRLPRRFAQKFFKSTRMRSHVVITEDEPRPYRIAHKNLLGPSDIDQQRLPVLASPLDRVLRGGAPAGGRDRLPIPVSYAGTDNPVSGATALLSPGDDAAIQEIAAMLLFDETDRLAHRHRVKQTRDASPLRVLVTRRTLLDRTRDIQRRLVVLGYDVGGIDGQIGRKMIAATKAFQAANDLRVTGLPNDATRQLLNEQTGMAQPAEATVYVRQNGRDIYSGPIQLEQPSEPIGTHLFTLADIGDKPEIREWLAVTAQAKGRLPSWSKRDWIDKLPEIKPVTAAEAIGRVRFPTHVRQAIEDRLTPGSSLIIADGGSESETGLATDFIVLTD